MSFWFNFVESLQFGRFADRVAPVLRPEGLLLRGSFTKLKGRYFEYRPFFWQITTYDR